ncbi:hypothetical protein GH5_07091 [Leishmania sp. Ghana 2012 LV757]|uniref:hypothetical protein n=1 Tax=Leishmania sp. Ghana 2012 LV757 TaxID=2803181 RepID=UPI001B43FBAA|nr:hypothetical protein GH5_07091 [Leishmania sp. Ghana 2012 LV757]
MSAPYLLSSLHTIASWGPPPIAMLTWMLAMEERLGRQAVHIAELEARHDITALLARSSFAVPPLSPRRTGRPFSSEPRSQLESLAAASSDHGEEDYATAMQHSCRAASPTSSPAPAALSLRHTRCARQVGASAWELGNGAPCSSELPQLSSFWRQLAGLDERLTEVECSLMQCEGTPSPTDVSPPQERCAHSSRPTMDDCVTLLDSLLASREATCTPRWTTATAGAAPAVALRRPPQASKRDLPLQHHTRQQYTLGVLAKLRDALRSAQASYRAAAGVDTHVSLETLLQLPPETLPLLTCNSDSEHNSHQLHRHHPCAASSRTAAWCGLPSNTSPYTLWTALMDGVDMFPSFSRAAAEALWAAVLWMHACAPLALPIQSEAPLSARASLRSDSATGAAAPRGQTCCAYTASGKGGSSRLRPLQAVTQPSPPRTGSASTLQRQPERSEAEPRPVRFSLEMRQRRAARDQSIAVSIVKSRLQEEEERWAYRVLPVCSGCTAPTVYDDLFPLPTAVSAFVQPPPQSSPSPSLSAKGSNGAAVADARGWTGAAVRSDFYTGPARRPRSLA